MGYKFFQPPQPPSNQNSCPGKASSGQPKGSVIFHKEDLILIPFSLSGMALPFSGKRASRECGEGQAHGRWTFGMLWGIPFVLIGQYLIWGRFLHAAWLKGRTHYAVTSGYRGAGRLETANGLGLH